MTDLQIPSIDWLAISPEISLFAAAVLIVLIRSIVRHSPRVFEASMLTATAGIVAAGYFTASQWAAVRDDGPYQAIRGMVAVDGFSVFVRAVVLLSTALALMISAGYLRREGFEGPEYVALMLLSATGMTIMASANDLIVVFLALEVLSISLYVLAAFDRNRIESQEAGLKYFVLGAFSSSIFLYGVALVYGATGTTSLTGIAQFLARAGLLDAGTLMVGLALLLVGLGFKTAAVPFHMWAPDVYQGSPTPVTGFMASATKVAAFAALLRVFVGSFGLYRVDWRPAIWVLAVLSLVVGAVAAAVQTDVKRMLAYSSVSHAGYVLIGVQVATSRGTSASLVYLMVYALMALGAFGVVTIVGGRGDSHHALDDYRGLAAREPVIAGFLALFLLAQAGVPATAGFVAKLGVFAAAVASGQYALAIVGMLAAAIAAFVYLRIVLAMYAGDDRQQGMAAGPGEPRPRLRVDAATATALIVAAVLVIALGVVPGRLLDFARDATLLLVGAR